MSIGSKLQYVRLFLFDIIMTRYYDQVVKRLYKERCYV